VTKSLQRLGTAAGAKVYSPWLLRVYDWVVLGWYARVLWKCRASYILDLYNRHVSDEHLDVGVGSGYFLDKCRYPSASPKISLFDLNENSLSFTARRIARYDPELYCGDVFDPLPFAAGRFRSVGTSGLLHCLPGDFSEKSAVFTNVSRCMAPDAVLFGATLVNTPERMNWLAKWTLADFNRRKILSNLKDTPAQLERELSYCFDSVQVWLEGSVALFVARK
jgi:ubiquinone/menaquinone biosynthesis C-methylase UbiE